MNVQGQENLLPKIGLAYRVAVEILHDSERQDNEIISHVQAVQLVIKLRAVWYHVRGRLETGYGDIDPKGHA